MPNAIKALLVVDVQNDFCEGGALPIKGGAAVASRITEYLKHWKTGPVLASLCAHVDPVEHFEKWGPHCVIGTRGFEPHPNLDYGRVSVVEFLKGGWQDDYSAFQGRCDLDFSLDQVLKQNHVAEVEVCGLAFDECVKYTALDAVANGYLTTILYDLTAPLAPRGSQQLAETIAELASAGVRFR